jgi:hypothetical protein
MPNRAKPLPDDLTAFREYIAEGFRQVNQRLDDHESKEGARDEKLDTMAEAAKTMADAHQKMVKLVGDALKVTQAYAVMRVELDGLKTAHSQLEFRIIAIEDHLDLKKVELP